MPALRSSTETMFSAVNEWLNVTDIATPATDVMKLVESLAEVLDNERQNAYSRGFDAGKDANSSRQLEIAQ